MEVRTKIPLEMEKRNSLKLFQGIQPGKEKKIDRYYQP